MKVTVTREMPWRIMGMGGRRKLENWGDVKLIFLSFPGLPPALNLKFYSIQGGTQIFRPLPEPPPPPSPLEKFIKRHLEKVQARGRG